ncbi:MAG: glycosyltransferase family 2 protein [Sphingobium sp.]|jgi:GT2 family glycosyltransferase|nr:glycosyltransferase family 2 protein [Sphingobium sp.]MCI2052824.1 glycosyltransferase family 2 protein [Sphingobium sp.]
MSIFSSCRSNPWRSCAALFSILKLSWEYSWIDTIDAIFDIIKNKRVRAWNKLNKSASMNYRYYERWISISEPKIALDLTINSESNKECVRPIFLVLDNGGDLVKATRTVDSIRQAFGPDIDVWVQNLIFDGCRSLSSKLSIFATLRTIIADGDPSKKWIFPIRAGSLISSRTAPMLAKACHASVAHEIVYWDSDEICNGNRCRPWIKGNWDPLLYISQDYLIESCVFRGSCGLNAAQKMNSENSFVESFSELILDIAINIKYNDPFHIPYIITHIDEEGKCENKNINNKNKIINNAYDDLSTNKKNILNIYKNKINFWPKVTIIIPTKDQFFLLKKCIDSINILNYPADCEIIIVDNGSTQPDAVHFIDSLSKNKKVHIIRDSRPFNYSQLNNMAARQSSGDVLCLLNNDVEALDGDWLATMVRYAAQPCVGAVGAMLVYPDGAIQHAGVAVGIGGAAGHLARGCRPEDGNFFSWHSVTRTVSAVTAACLVVRRDAYFSIGGLDEASFAVAFNDVDFCLRLQQRGLRNVFVAEARLIHHESISRGSDHVGENRKRFQNELKCFRERWIGNGYIDPYYSSLFLESSDSCLLKF